MLLMALQRDKQSSTVAQGASSFQSPPVSTATGWWSLRARTLVQTLPVRERSTTVRVAAIFLASVPCVMTRPPTNSLSWCLMSRGDASACTTWVVLEQGRVGGGVGVRLPLALPPPGFEEGGRKGEEEVESADLGG